RRTLSEVVKDAGSRHDQDVVPAHDPERGNEIQQLSRHSEEHPVQGEGPSREVARWPDQRAGDLVVDGDSGRSGTDAEKFCIRPLPAKHLEHDFKRALVAMIADPEQSEDGDPAGRGTSGPCFGRVPLRCALMSLARSMFEDSISLSHRQLPVMASPSGWCGAGAWPGGVP